MQARQYMLGGLVLRSEIGLPHADLVDADAWSVDIVLGPESIKGAELVLERSSPDVDRPYLRIFRGQEGYVLDHVDGLTAEVTDGGRRVTVSRLDPALPPSTIEHILLDQLLPLVFAHLGRLSFHGSGASVDGRAICFLADAKTGKSTLAAALVAHAGASLIADDEVLLEDGPDGFLAHRSYPAVRLWDESAHALFRAAATSGEKHVFDVVATRAGTPLAAMVLLERGEAEQRDVLEIVTLSPRDGLVGVATHLDRLDPTDRSALRRELEALARLAEHTTIVRMRVARSFSRLAEAANALRSWARELHPHPS